MKSALSLALCSVVALSCTLLLSGCEDEPDLRGVGSYFDQNPIGSEPRAGGTAPTVVVTPNTKSLATDGETASFAAVGGFPSYTWSVNDISKGSVLQQGQESAVYQRAAAGDNVVICTDSRGNRAFATISQP